jgi:hypothetical protein
MSTKHPALNRFTAYTWYLGSAFWRERAPTISGCGAGPGNPREAAQRHVDAIIPRVVAAGLGGP